jgi:hypothetical protein
MNKQSLIFLTIISLIFIAFVIIFLPKKLWLPTIIVSPIPPIP